MSENNTARPVSPINGQPLPRGKPFTSDSAREARQKRTKADSERASIAEAFRKQMRETFMVHDKRTGKQVEKTGAEVIADSIIQACSKGNANAMNIALGLLGEKPAESVNVNMPDPAIMEEIRRRLDGESA